MGHELKGLGTPGLQYVAFEGCTRYCTGWLERLIQMDSNQAFKRIKTQFMWFRQRRHLGSQGLAISTPVFSCIVKFSAENVCRFIYILNQCNAHPSLCGMSSIVLSATLHLFANFSLDLFLNGASGFSTTVDHETAFCSVYNNADH